MAQLERDSTMTAGLSLDKVGNQAADDALPEIDGVKMRMLPCRSFLTHCLQSLDCVFYLSNVRAFPGSLIEREVLVDSDQPQALSPWGLKVEVGVRHIKLPDETGFEDFSAHLLNVVGLDFQKNRSE